MTPPLTRRRFTVLDHLFGVRLGERAIVWAQNPLVLEEHWEPQLAETPLSE